MGSNAVRRVAIPALGAVLGLVLAACTSNGKNDEVNPNIFPTNYKQEILDTMTHILADPTNVRDAFISEPALTTVSKEQRYAACVRSNSRDGSLRYIGSADRIAYFFGGHLNQLIEATPEQCAKAPYKPFPELEKLCLAKKCA